MYYMNSDAGAVTEAGGAAALQQANKLLPEEHQMEAMLPYLRTHLDVVDDLLTPGIPRNKVYSTWRMEKPER